jgi:hypothetical protein
MEHIYSHPRTIVHIRRSKRSVEGKEAEKAERVGKERGCDLESSTPVG